MRWHHQNCNHVDQNNIEKLNNSQKKSQIIIKTKFLSVFLNLTSVSRDLYIFWIFSYGISVESFIIMGYVRLQILDLLKLKWLWWIEQTAYINFYKQTTFSLTLHYSCFSPVYSFSKTKTKTKKNKKKNEKTKKTNN